MLRKLNLGIFLMLVGIDFGKKLSGNTVIAYSVDSINVKFEKSNKREDADELIHDFILRHLPEEVFIDAPLSLPGVYKGLANCEDYFFRKADRVTRGMSPMFLGGLTARAIRLKDMAAGISVIFHETFPSYLARHWNLDKAGYKKSNQHIINVMELIRKQVKFDLEEIESWHDIDALLALISHSRYREGKAKIFGINEEGLIYV